MSDVERINLTYVLVLRLDMSDLRVVKNDRPVCVEKLLTSHIWFICWKTKQTKKLNIDRHMCALVFSHSPASLRAGEMLHWRLWPKSSFTNRWRSNVLLRVGSTGHGLPGPSDHARMYSTWCDCCKTTAAAKLQNLFPKQGLLIKLL